MVNTQEGCWKYDVMPNPCSEPYQIQCHECNMPVTITQIERNKFMGTTASYNGKSLLRCCCIPDQKTGVQCDNNADYEIFGDGPENNTLSCAKHLEEMLDISNRFEIVRINENRHKEYTERKEAK